ncbi:hypothetical protein V5E97_37190 [Singulisphaera sp. Ch08]|uniref:Uncharacterized protein n=1 Tax=Singulisphaera sp. Ch08 TaxID=3120278 RepID=A0AAU7CFW7_9BACT
MPNKALPIQTCCTIVISPVAVASFHTIHIGPSNSSTVIDRISYVCHRLAVINHSNAKTGPGPVSFAMQSPIGFTLSGQVIGVKPNPVS